MCKNYYIENNLLYKVSLPRTKKQQRVRPQNYLLFIPAKHTANLLHEWHAILGHYGPNRLLPCLSTRFTGLNCWLTSRLFLGSVKFANSPK